MLDVSKKAVPIGTVAVLQLALLLKLPSVGLASQVASCARATPGSSAATATNAVVASSAAIRQFRRWRAGNAVPGRSTAANGKWPVGKRSVGKRSVTPHPPARKSAYVRSPAERNRRHAGSGDFETVSQISNIGSPSTCGRPPLMSRWGQKQIARERPVWRKADEGFRHPAPSIDHAVGGASPRGGEHDRAQSPHFVLLNRRAKYLQDL